MIQRAVLTMAALAVGAWPAASQWRRADTPAVLVVGPAGASRLRDRAVTFESLRDTNEAMRRMEALTSAAQGPPPAAPPAEPARQGTAPATPAAGNGTQTAGAAGTSDREPARATGGSGTAQPVYRVVRPGEQRVTGMLRRIQCTATAVAFQLSIPGGQQRLTAARLADVDFISYRQDFTGSVACGPVFPPASVYVTLGRPQGRAATRSVVAVEFLPAPRR